MKSLHTLLNLLVLLFPFASRMLAGEFEMQAAILVPDGQHRLIVGTPLHIRLYLTNATEQRIVLATIRLKGVEQLTEEPRPVRSEDILPVYLDKVSLAFTEVQSGEVTLRHAYFPYSGPIESGGSISTLLTTVAPEKPRYSVKIKVERNPREGGFAFPDESPERKAADEGRKIQIPECGLKDIPIELPGSSTK
jgi:hypothetical protein